MPDPVKVAEDQQAIFQAVLDHAQNIQETYQDRMKEFDKRVAEIESERDRITRYFEIGDRRIAEYTEKIRNQRAIVRHIIRCTEVIGRRHDGTAFRSEAPITKAVSLQARIRKLEREMDFEERHPEIVAERKALKSGRWSEKQQHSGVIFYRQRKDRKWFYCDITGGTMYGPFDSITHARKNASVPK